MEEGPAEKKSGCGLLTAVFGRRALWVKKPSNENGSHKSTTSSTTTATTATPNGHANPRIQFTKSPGNAAVSDEQPILHPAFPKSEQALKPIVPKNPQIRFPNNNLNHNNPNHQLAGYGNHQSYNNNNNKQQQGRKVPKEAIGLSGELDLMIADHQKQRGNNNSLVRASSSNVMLFGNLGNIRQPGGGPVNYGVSQNQADSQTNYATKKTQNNNDHHQEQIKPRAVVAPAAASQPQEQTGSLCRAISTRMDPETLKIMGNEDYKNGNFAEAVALYDAAIAIDSNKASYRSNKSAALTALGRILDAVYECREAIRIEPHYHRAHHRLGNLYVRLGEVEKAIYHYKHAGPEADPEDIANAKTVQAHLSKCAEAKRLRDWNNLIKESRNSVLAGADSAPQVYALQAEALLKIHRHQEADEALGKSPDFGTDASAKYYGPVGYANFLVVRAQVDLALGRFDDALEVVQRAGRLDGSNREVSMVTRRIKAVMAARSKGNDLFKAGRFEQAEAAYGEGLEHDPRNSVLLCNRAACRSKTGQLLKAVEDCSVALNVRPGYAKPRLRRADCFAKLGNLEASIQDYEILKKEMPDDEEVARGLSEAQQQLRKRRGQDA